MLKRNIGVVAAGLLLGAQIGFAAADESAVPLGAQAIRVQGEPVARSSYQTGRTSKRTWTTSRSRWTALAWWCSTRRKAPRA